MSENELATVDEKALAEAMAAQQQSGFGQDLEAKDLEQGYIILLQDKNPLLRDPDYEAWAARSGDIVRTDTKEKIAGSKEGEQCELLIIDVFKTWRMTCTDKGPNKGKNLGSMPFVLGEGQPPDGVTESGQNYYCQLQFNFMCVIASDLTAIPLILPLRSSSTGAARFLNKECILAVEKKVASWDKIYTIHSYLYDTDRGNFHTVAKAGRESTPEEKMAAAKWFIMSRDKKPKEATQTVVANEKAASDVDPEFDEDDPI